MKVLVTGAAGFIGFHTARRFLAAGYQVTGIDNLNDYYDPVLKQARLDRLLGTEGFDFHKLDVIDGDRLSRLVGDGGFDRVIHLAAQAGVRYSIENPLAYVQSNLLGFGNILEACRHAGTPHLVYASSSSVYGANRSIPFSEHDVADHPLSLYAATKRVNELMAYSYSNLYGLPTTGLRFFTVYGPWGRPDMALFLFTRAMLAGEPIQVFNYGRHRRDFSYIDDVVTGVQIVAQGIPQPNPDWDAENPDPAIGPGPCRIYNIGNNNPVELEDFIAALETRLGKKAIRENLPLQVGDVPDTWADCADLERDFAYRPATPVEEGIGKFVDWYLEYYPQE